jgi:hypothetical protein
MDNAMGSGFIAIWSDIDPAAETDYLHWMTREHAIERLSIPGFLAMRMFRALHVTARRYLIIYELDNPDVVGGADYQARLNNPTPWSQRIMPQLRNFIRGGGRVVATAGAGQGGFIAALPLDDLAGFDVASLIKTDRISSARLCVTDMAQTTIKTKEKGMRSGDRSFNGLLLIEGGDEAAIRAALATLPSPPADASVYSPIFALRSGDI